MSWRQPGSSGRALDLVAVGTLLVMGLVEAFLAPPAVTTLWQQALLAVVYPLALLWRRKHPIPVFALIIALGPVLAEVNTRGGVISYVLAAILASYTVGRLLDPPATWWGPALTVGFGWTVFALTGAEVSDYVFVALLYGGAWAVGFALRQRERRITALLGEADRLRQKVTEEAARAAAEERIRIARELHDIVSHGISVITIQSQAIRRRLPPQFGREIDDLRGIELTARQAMQEMRKLLGVLRADPSSPAPLAPQPGLAQLDQLIADAEAAGVRVELTMQGQPPTPLSPGVDLTLYRLVQEALTNVRKHSGSSSVRVAIEYTADAIRLRVDDDGDGASSLSDRPGHGLIGMTERVHLYGGRIDAGRRADGGYRVLAELPLRDATLR